MNPRNLILIVEDDEILAEMLESTIELHNPSYATRCCQTPEEAVRHLHMERADVVVTELVFNRSARGHDFAIALARHEEPLSHLILTDLPVHEIPRQIKTSSIVHKPVEMDAFLRRLDALIPASSDSSFRGISLDTLLQVLHQELKTCTLTVTCQGRAGWLCLRLGELIHAQTAHLGGKDAALEILSWDSPAITWAEGCTAERSIREPLNSVLLEWCIQKDHCAA